MIRKLEAHRQSPPKEFLPFVNLGRISAILAMITTTAALPKTSRQVR